MVWEAADVHMSALDEDSGRALPPGCGLQHSASGTVRELCGLVSREQLEKEKNAVCPLRDFQLSRTLPTLTPEQPHDVRPFWPWICSRLHRTRFEIFTAGSGQFVVISSRGMKTQVMPVHEILVIIMPHGASMVLMTRPACLGKILFTRDCLTAPCSALRMCSWERSAACEEPTSNLRGPVRVAAAAYYTKEATITPKKSELTATGNGIPYLFSEIRRGQVIARRQR